MKKHVAMRRYARWLALLCAMLTLCLPFGTGMASTEPVLEGDTISIVEATPPPVQGDFVDIPGLSPLPDVQDTPAPPMISEPDGSIPQPPETGLASVGQPPTIDELPSINDTGSAPPILEEILIPGLEDSLPSSLQVLQQQKPVVVAGNTFDLQLYIDFSIGGYSHVTNKGLDTGESLSYAPGIDPLQRYDQGIASQIEYASLAFATEWGGSESLVLDYASLSGQVIDGGINRGYAVISGLHVPDFVQPGDYTLMLKVFWRANVPLAGEQISYATIPYEVTAPAQEIAPLAGKPWGDGIIVYSHQELIDAVANTAYSTIYLGYSAENQGTIAYQKMQPMPIGRNLIIDGTDPLTGYRMRLQDWNSSNAQDGMYASVSGITVTFRHIDLTVQNYFGILYGTGQQNVQLQFVDVNARARQLAHNAGAGSAVTFTDSTVDVTNVGSGSEHEVLEAPNVLFYGHNTMTRTGPTDNSMFWLHGDSSLSFTVSSGASLALNTTNYMIFTGNSAATTVNLYGDLSLATAGPNGSVTYADQYIGKLVIHPEGSMTVQHNNSSTRPSLLARDLSVSGRLEIRRTSSASAVIRLESGGSFMADNPSLILLDNPGGSILRSLGPATLRWSTPVINRYTGGNLVSVWNRQDLATFDSVYTLSGNNAVVQNVTYLDNEDRGAAVGAPVLSGTLPLGLDSHLALGRAVLSLDTVYGGQTLVTGHAASGAALTITEYVYDGGQLGGMIQQQATVADSRFSVTLPRAISLSGNRIYAISDDGVLISHTYQDPQLSGPIFAKVPETLVFETTSLSSQDQLIQRVDPDWSIEVFDGGSNGFTLFARIDEPLTASTGEQLKDGLVFAHDGQVQPLSPTEWPVYHQDNNSPGTTHTIRWQEEEGILTRLPAFEGVAGVPYSATIVWTLAVGP